MSAIGSFMTSTSARINYEWALRRSDHVPFVMTTEFPRSGGNWFRDMLGDVLQLPVPRFSRLPITFRAIAHNHDHRVLRGGKAVYILRDGRDVFVSHMHKAISACVNGSSVDRRRTTRRHPSLKNVRTEADRDKVVVRAFYMEWRLRPIGSRVNWGDHVTAWLRSPEFPAAAVVKYEQLRSDPRRVLSTVAYHLSGEYPDEAAVEFAVARNTFESQTGREAGVIDQSSTKRQGLVGGWKTALDPEIVSLFHDDFKEALALAGYEA